MKLMNNQAKPIRIPINVLCKYPFLNASMDYVKQKAISPIDALYNHIGILDQIKSIITDSLENMEETSHLPHDSDDAIYLYPWMRIILAFMKLPRVTYKVANLISKHFSKLLGNEDESTLVDIAKDQGIFVSRATETQAISIKTVSFPFRLPVLDYLKISAKFKSPAWKLVNRLLQGGNVFLRKHDLARMIEELVKTKLSEVTTALNDDELKKSFMDQPILKMKYDGIMAITKEKIATTTGGDETLPIDNNAFPPCINAILDKNSKGINLTHSERLFLVYFLLTIGKTVEEVLDLFRNQPDYNEKISRYQVEFAAGKHGKQTQYKPHNCMTLESINICRKSDPVFGSKKCTEPKPPFKNPLTFYRRVSWGRAHAGNQSIPGKNVGSETEDQEVLPEEP
jgi:DNA primase large subunit